MVARCFRLTLHRFGPLEVIEPILRSDMDLDFGQCIAESVRFLPRGYAKPGVKIRAGKPFEQLRAGVGISIDEGVELALR